MQVSLLDIRGDVKVSDQVVLTEEKCKIDIISFMSLVQIPSCLFK